LPPFIWKNPDAHPKMLKEMTMESSHTDAFLFFSATGDLAREKVFPALQATTKRGHVDVPVRGLPMDWTFEQLRARALDSLQGHGGVDAAAFRRLSSLLRYVDGDY
jgi:glucose-6-phosphate 1-dehydrogenase